MCRRPEVFCKKGVLKVCNFLKRGTLTQVFSCQFCKTLKSIFFYRTPLVATSGYRKYSTGKKVFDLIKFKKALSFRNMQIFKFLFNKSQYPCRTDVSQIFHLNSMLWSSFLIYCIFHKGLLLSFHHKSLY